MPPKLKVKSKLDIKDLLSHQYDPADYTLGDFQEHYQRLVDHRDEIRKQYDRKKQTRANLRQPEGKILNLRTSNDLADTPSANPPKGSRFSSLLDDEDGSSNSALTKLTISATKSKKQLKKLPQHERKAPVRKIKEEIAAMKAEMKEQKGNDNEARKAAENTKEQNEHQKTVEENQDEADESGQD